MLAQDIIIKPILSEKSYADIANKKYYFEVAKKATKTQIKAAVEQIFKVTSEMYAFSPQYSSNLFKITFS